MKADIRSKIKTDLINTGIFLESDTYQLFKKWNTNRVFQVHREYPYSYVTNGQQTIDGTVDVLAETGVTDFGNSRVVVFPIECKKADPRLKHWVFEPHRSDKDKEKPYFLTAKGIDEYFTNRYNLPGLGYNAPSDLENCVQVFEFSEADGRISVQSQKEIRAFYAVQQVNEAVPGLVQKFGDFSRSTDVHNIFIPVVVTTANLWLTEYDPAKIDKESATIDSKELNLKPKDWILYSYPLRTSESLPGKAKDTHGERVSITPNKRPTFIVRASALEAFVKNVLSDVTNYFFELDDL